MPLGLYVHIPFCKSKCGYCDFVSYAGKDALINDYLKALEKEAELYQRFKNGFPTLYIGGGTPSRLSPGQLARLFDILGRNLCDIRNLRESTFEANPESLDSVKIDLLKASGFNRVSLGMQTSNEALLKKLGRIATHKDFLNAFEELRKLGFDNINADLMTGLPGQTEADFRTSLSELIKLRPEHISLYPLEVHAGTPFHEKGIAEAPDPAAGMYGTAVKELKTAGYVHYEISNFALPGKESTHNLNYWEQGEYIGLGPGAASYLNGERFANIPGIEPYINSLLNKAGPRISYSEKLEGREKDGEKIMLGLRKTAGIELPDDIFIEFRPQIEKLAGQGLLEVNGRTIKISGEKTYLADAVFREFV